MSIKSELCKDFAGEDGGKFVSHRAWHRVMFSYNAVKARRCEPSLTN